jgi:hypothetical protein
MRAATESIPVDKIKVTCAGMSQRVNQAGTKEIFLTL